MEKIIKIQEFYRQRSKYDKRMNIVPKLTFSGNWLSEAGFKPSKMVKVECRNNQLIVTSIE